RRDDQRGQHAGVLELAAIVLDGAVEQDRERQQAGGGVEAAHLGLGLGLRRAAPTPKRRTRRDQAGAETGRAGGGWLGLGCPWLSCASRAAPAVQAPGQPDTMHRVPIYPPLGFRGGGG